ncbi:hypothetical protein PoB_003188500 [Plakobranchus ocellatus]|uniref:Uncharacterized protein n=1 Tax=Plakobranchus ocellatus TaxID=259542 RepID=A0AAV4AB31_9GAST|nr:hypothetical protein PoB_003188500 [Plakobranchus ocellatus]
MFTGCNYCITAEDVFFTHRMDQIKLLLENDPDCLVNYSSPSHQCRDYNKPLDDGELIHLDNTPDIASNLRPDVRMALFFIEGLSPPSTQSTKVIQNVCNKK